MATYMVDHADGMAPDLLEDVGHVLLVRMITMKASTDVELTFFLTPRDLPLSSTQSAQPRHSPSPVFLHRCPRRGRGCARRVPLPPGLLLLCALPRPPGVERLSETGVESTTGR